MLTSLGIRKSGPPPGIHTRCSPPPTTSCCASRAEAPRRWDERRRDCRPVCGAADDSPAGMLSTVTAPVLVTVHIWGVARSRIPAALRRMATHRRVVRKYPGVTFAKLLGTGSGDTFTIRDSDATHWALLTCWDAPQAAATFERSRTIRSWNDASVERLRLELSPMAATGRWSGQQPFGSADDQPGDRQFDGNVAAITRARLRGATAVTFWRAVPPVSAALHRSPGLLFSLGIGEAPIGLQGTLSVWQSPADLAAFAYGSLEHQRAIHRTREVRWYTEELFARLALHNVEGTYRGRTLEVTT